MSCEACARPASGLYIGGCRQCQVRRLARSLPYAASVVAGKRTNEYRRLLEGAFGADWAVGHADVKAEADRLRAGQGALL